MGVAWGNLQAVLHSDSHGLPSPPRWCCVALASFLPVRCADERRDHCQCTPALSPGCRRTPPPDRQRSTARAGARASRAEELIMCLCRAAGAVLVSAVILFGDDWGYGDIGANPACDIF